MSSRLVGAVSLLALMMPAAAEARSAAAQYVLDQHIRETCGGGGNFRATLNGIPLAVEADLSGDGKPDFIFDSRGIECADGSSLAGCGPAACNVYFYVRRGKLLKPAGDAFSIGFTVKRGKPARIELQDSNFREYVVRWKGSGFR